MSVPAKLPNDEDDDLLKKLEKAKKNIEGSSLSFDKTLRDISKFNKKMLYGGIGIGCGGMTSVVLSSATVISSPAMLTAFFAFAGGCIGALIGSSKKEFEFDLFQDRLSQAMNRREVDLAMLNAQILQPHRKGSNEVALLQDHAQLLITMKPHDLVKYYFPD